MSFWYTIQAADGPSVARGQMATSAPVYCTSNQDNSTMGVFPKYAWLILRSESDSNIQYRQQIVHVWPENAWQPQATALVTKLTAQWGLILRSQNRGEAASSQWCMVLSTRTPGLKSDIYTFFLPFDSISPRPSDCSHNLTQEKLFTRQDYFASSHYWLWKQFCWF